MRKLERSAPEPLTKEKAEVYLIKESAFGNGPGLVIPALPASARRKSANNTDGHGGQDPPDGGVSTVYCKHRRVLRIGSQRMRRQVRGKRGPQGGRLRYTDIKWELLEKKKKDS